MSIQLHDKTFVPYLSAAEISARVAGLGAELGQRFPADSCPLVLGVLNGAFLFTADLVRHYPAQCEVGFVRLKSYAGTRSTGEVQLLSDIPDVRGRHLILVEDIVDSGETLAAFLPLLQRAAPASLTICALLFKPGNLRHPEAKPDLAGFVIPNDFVVGYGLDYDGLGRNLPEIYVIDEG